MPVFESLGRCLVNEAPPLSSPTSTAGRVWESSGPGLRGPEGSFEAGPEVLLRGALYRVS